MDGYKQILKQKRKTENFMMTISYDKISISCDCAKYLGIDNELHGKSEIIYVKIFYNEFLNRIAFKKAEKDDADRYMFARQSNKKKSRFYIKSQPLVQIVLKNLKEELPSKSNYFHELCWNEMDKIFETTIKE